MEPPPRSSEPGDEPSETALAVLTACHHRGALTAAELGQLLSADAGQEALLALLSAGGLLDRHGERYAITQKGRELLDRVLEGIESQLTPDDPAYVRRYRRATPTLPFDANTIWAEAIAVNYHLDPAA